MERFCEDAGQTCINYVVDKKTIMSLILYQTYLIVTLTAPKDSLTPNDKLEDISQKGHWGVGMCRMRIETSDDIWIAMDYLQQMIGSEKRKAV